MKHIVTGFGGTVILGYIIDGIFKYHPKFPRKQKKTLRKKMPWVTFHKSPIDYVIEKTIPKNWYSNDYSFALTIADKPISGERLLYFNPFFDIKEVKDNKHLYYKTINGEPTKNNLLGNK